MLSLIVAMDKHGAIGLNNQMPWHMPSDLKHFKKTTLHQKVVMGRKTMEHLPKKLNDRELYCVSRSKEVKLNVNQPFQLINDFEAFCKEHATSDELYYIAGGQSIYQMALPYVSEMIISFISGEYKADTYFSSFVDKQFKIVSRQKFIDFEVVTYRRKL